MVCPDSKRTNYRHSQALNGIAAYTPSSPYSHIRLSGVLIRFLFYSAFALRKLPPFRQAFRSSFISLTPIEPGFYQAKAHNTKSQTTSMIDCLIREIVIQWGFSLEGRTALTTAAGSVAVFQHTGKKR